MARSRRKRFGQNFLIDERVAERIVSLLAQEPKQVLEIGPGRGALTTFLTGRFDRVVAVETDEQLVNGLRSTFQGAELEVVHGDALKVEYSEILRSDGPWQLASNLPYSVGTSIVRRLLPLGGLFTRMVVMLQTELVERLIAAPGDREHGLLALECAAYADTSLAFEVPPGAFRPRPKVWSSVVVITPKACAFPENDLKRAFSLASHALTKRRKKLSNALQPFAASAPILEADLDPNTRPGNLTLEDWVRLAQVTAPK
jgi:16S rRNA (adenine1518-N6/adenine1519-N6)-dimethyltransferase